MSKAEIRKEVKSRVAKMTDIEKEWASNAIIDELISSKAFRSANEGFDESRIDGCIRICVPACAQRLEVVTIHRAINVG